jgi:putative DNA primase/helicase
MSEPRKPPLSEKAKGRWTGILTHFGLGKFLTGKHCPCPICGGKDRFRYSDYEGRGNWICTSCGAGDGVSLVLKTQGIEFKEALARIEPLIGQIAYVEPKSQVDEEAAREALRRVWNNSTPVQPGDPVDLYLRRRLQRAFSSPALRSVGKLRYADDENTTFHPAMIAVVSDPGGRPVQIHRTYLTDDGHKADVPSPRRMMWGGIPKGSAVRLMEPGIELGVAEGIETAIAASLLFEVPVWSAINTTGLMEWEPPIGVERVLIFGDNDAKFAGQAAAFHLAKKLATYPKRQIAVEVHIPEVVSQDWNDVWLEQERDKVRQLVQNKLLAIAQTNVLRA